MAVGELTCFISITLNLLEIALWRKIIWFKIVFKLFEKKYLKPSLNIKPGTDTYHIYYFELFIRCGLYNHIFLGLSLILPMLAIFFRYIRDWFDTINHQPIPTLIMRLTLLDTIMFYLRIWNVSKTLRWTKTSHGVSILVLNLWKLKTLFLNHLMMLVVPLMLHIILFAQ